MAQQPVADGVIGPGPGEPLRDGVAHAAQWLVQRFLDDVVRTTANLTGGATRGGENEYARRVDAMDGQVRDRCASVSVFPVPAPARTSIGPALNPRGDNASPWVTALRCAP